MTGDPDQLSTGLLDLWNVLQDLSTEYTVESGIGKRETSDVSRDPTNSRMVKTREGAGPGP